MKDKFVDSFVLVNNNKVISPVLITIRSYGSWFEQTFDTYTTQTELYLKAKKEDGSSVLQYHPGTKIGKWFDSNSANFTSDNLQSWYILQDSTMMKRLVTLKLAQQKDAIPISVNDVEGRRMIRVYTKQQLDLYLRTLTRNNSFELPITVPKEIKVKDADMEKLIKPNFTSTRKKLF